jgi:hypothetical protein
MFSYGKCIALMGMLIVGNFAIAQSSATLYGLIDTGIDYYNNSGGKSLVETRDGVLTGLYGSRWGTQGQEDLGGGTKVVFRLENGFSSTKGALGQGGLELDGRLTLDSPPRSWATLLRAGNTTLLVITCNFLAPVRNEAASLLMRVTSTAFRIRSESTIL